jgi:hypothetical protein
MILDANQQGARAPVKSGPEARTMMADAPKIPVAPSVVVSPTVAPLPLHTLTGTPMLPMTTPLGTGQVMPFLPGARRPSTLWKDIVIGVAVAALLVGGVLGVRAMWGRSKGTLVVMANPARAANVLVDGALKGKLEEGKPLTLKDLTAGVHTVLVRADDGAEFAQKVSLAAGDVSVLSAPLAAPSPVEPTAATPGTGKLKLDVATDGAQVWVDGAQLADGAWKQSISLRADVAHEIRVSKPMREEVKLTVTLKPGEELQKSVELLPGYGKIKVASVPPGAEVNVNGHRAGATPTQVSDLDPGKSARVTLRLKGFRSVTKYVAFQAGLEQELLLKLVEGKDDDSGEPEVAAAAPGPKSPGPKPILADIAVDEPGKKPSKKDTEEDVPKDSAPQAASSSEPGFLVANTQPWAKVLIDGKDTGKTTPIAPRSKISLKPGKHVVTFVANGKRYNFDIVIEPAEDTRLIKQLADTP